MANAAQEHRRFPWLDQGERDEIRDIVEIALTILSFVFLGLLAIELAADLSAAGSRRVQLAQQLIWGIFAIEFAVRFIIADDRSRFLRANWLGALAVVLPSLRIFRAARAIRAVRGLRVVRLVTGTNRGMRALRRVAGFGGVGYVLLLSVLVVVLSAAGLYSLESGHPESTIDSWQEGLWWTATVVTTLGTENYPVTAEGRVLAFLVMVYGLGVSGYITAVVAVALLGLRDQPDGETAAEEIRALREEIQMVRIELAQRRGSTEATRNTPDSQ